MSSRSLKTTSLRMKNIFVAYINLMYTTIWDLFNAHVMTPVVAVAREIWPPYTKLYPTEDLHVT